MEINLKHTAMGKGSIADYAVDKAKDALGLNDTSVDAKLILNGTIYDIETFHIQFLKSNDYKGEPQREVKGGLMSISINHVVDKQINNWMFHPSVKHIFNTCWTPSTLPKTDGPGGILNGMWI
jgi:hypothetical protein